MIIKILTATIMIATMPAVQAYLYDFGKGSTKDQYLFYLRTGQFEEVTKIVSIAKSGELPEIKLNQYFDGNQAAKYLCSLGSKQGDSLAYELWQKMIGTAANENHLDSALFLAESWVKNMPTLDLPKTILGKVHQSMGCK